MNEILNMSINDMAGASFDCSCGRHHNIPIKSINIGKNVLPAVCDAVKTLGGGKLFLFCDQNTWKVAGERVYSMLSDCKYEIKKFVFQTGDEMLIPDEYALGRLLFEVPTDTDLIVSVGSGVLNDLAKFISSRMHIPYMIVGTAPSMDGYVSNSSCMTYDGKKLTFPTILPAAVVCDTEIMRNAPIRMLHAGFGDVIGKLTALADWELARRKNGDYFCATSATLVREALECVTKQASKIKERDEEAVNALIRALVLTGIAMTLTDITRPASGSEHTLSHFWEMDLHARGLYADFHGTKVGAATPVAIEIFEILHDDIDEDICAMLPSREECEELLRAAGAPIFPQDVGIDKDLFHRSVLGAYAIRERYSVMRMAHDMGKLEDCAAKITKRIYG